MIFTPRREVGVGDGLGTIILPGGLPEVPAHPVLYWPGLATGAPGLGD